MSYLFFIPSISFSISSMLVIKFFQQLIVKRWPFLDCWLLEAANHRLQQSWDLQHTPPRLLKRSKLTLFSKSELNVVPAIAVLNTKYQYFFFMSVDYNFYFLFGLFLTINVYFLGVFSLQKLWDLSDWICKLENQFFYKV